MNNAKIVLTLMSIVLLSGALVSAEDAFATIAPPVITTNNATTSAATIDISGTNDSTATIVTVSNGTTNVIATIDGTGTAWIATIPLSTIDGDTNTITAIQTDGTFTSAVSNSVTITINNAIPAPGTPNLAAISDKGSSRTDNITNVNTPLFTGTGEEGATVTLTATATGGAVVTGTDVVENGNWSIQPTLTAGTYFVSATQTDTAGNISVPSDSLTPSLMIDNTVPGAVPLDLDASSDSGISDTDNITNEVILQFTGSAEPGASVKIFTAFSTTSTTPAVSLTATVTAVPTTDPTIGTWTYTTPTLTDGTYAIQGVQTDVAGNAQLVVSTTRSVTVDTLAPAAPSINSFTTPTNTLPTLSGAMESGTTVLITIGTATAVAPTTTPTATSWTYVITSLSEGANSISVVATDTAGNPSTATTSSITYDTMPADPPGTPDLIDSSDTGSSDTDNITSDTTPEFTGTGVVGATVTLTATGGAVVTGTGTVDNNGNWSIELTLTAGTYSVSATQTDAVGNTSDPSGSLTSLLIDTLAPTTIGNIDLDASSDTGSSNTDDITNDITPTFSGTNGDEAGAKLVLTATSPSGVQTITNGLTTVQSDFSWSITSSNIHVASIEQGDYEFKVHQIDVAGNIQVLGFKTINITLDTLAPTTIGNIDLDASSDTGSSSIDNLTNDITPTFSGTNGDEAGAKLVLTATSPSGVQTITNGLTTVQSDFSWSITSSDIHVASIEQGDYEFKVHQIDVAGNIQVLGFKTINITLDTLAPTTIGDIDLDASSDTGSSNTDDITNATAPTFSGTNGDEAGAKLVLTATSPSGVQTITNGTTTVQSDFSWSITSSNIHVASIEQGDYEFKVHQIDVAGNIQVLGFKTINITLDTLAPTTIGNIDLDASSDTGIPTAANYNTDNLTNATGPTFSGDNGDAGANLVLTATSPSGVQTITNGTTTVQSDLSWSITSSELTKTNGILEQGSYRFTVHQIDVAGNIQVLGFKTINVTLDTISPNVGAIGSKSITEYTTLSFTVTSSDVHTVTYSLTGAPSGASINSSTGVFTWTPIGEHVGISTITITATDAANNAISETISVTVHKTSGGDSAGKHKTKPTFGIDLKTGRQIIDGGFSFNGVSHDITDNFWTPFAEQEVKVGQTNTFTIKTFAQKQLKIQEFLFGIPQVGDAHKAELDVEIYFNYDGTVESVNAVQKSNVIDVDTIKVVTFDSKCASGDEVQRCTTTQLTMMFLEPLQDKVMAIKAMDFKNRYQITYLNDGFDVTGESLNPMLTQQIAGPEKYEGQVTVTQTSKYSNIWVTEDGREFQTNDSGTFTQINNDTYERITDSGVVKNRTHSEFVNYKAMQTERVIVFLENTCPNCFESFADFEDSWQYDYPEEVDRLEVLKDAIMLEQQRATIFLTDAQKYTRSN